MEMMVWRKTTLSYWFVKIRAKVILKVNYKNKTDDGGGDDGVAYY